ncbi:endo-beta-N-acetylglucosaminidase H [Microbacterium sp. SA39]|uniref:endo-beta-N-acetylglucosaminidase H n=1 Tax=Microbacterium sp. SA39 TaxID=1263625 RepID=UPI00061DFDA3|nr:endo-beta-N-acetylglucosaminidase H [Microbacterium sp. SA39]KJQ55390.1 Endo-beta-N-acetylglucosaminidase precursor [Microbacterium sp. SA39]
MSQPRIRIHRFRKGLAAAAGLAVAAVGTVAATPAAATEVPEYDPQLAVYVEVNSNDLANVADYTLADSGEAAIDMAMIFAANINYDGEKAYLHFNERVTETLKDAENQIRPVQEQGTKVLLSVLGNHQGAGFANFTSYEQADAFAAQLADAVTTYGLDGIDFDDEWTEYGANGTPQPNAESFGWLATALRERLGDDKIITLYAIGPSYTTTDFTLFDAEGVLDYAWNPYYPTYDAPTVPGLEDRTRIGAAAIDLANTSAATASGFANRTVADGYGVYVAYNLTANDQSTYLSGITQALKGEATEYRAAPKG